MKRTPHGLTLSATDLAHHLACRHLTMLDREVAEGRLAGPDWRRPEVQVLEARGLAHERAYLEHLEAQGRQIHRLDDAEDRTRAVERTVAAMRASADVIVQASLASGRWLGRADVLARVDRPSRLGDWSYEVHDTKLSRETRGGTILQLCLYSEILAEIQGVSPEWMWVVTPHTGFQAQGYRVAEYLAYYRLVRRRLEQAVDREDGPATYPEPVSHCDVCAWWSECERRRRADDHLSLVAGISRLQRRELQSREVTRLEALAAVALPLPWKPERGSRIGFERVREQARVQLEGRRSEAPVHELLPLEPERGLLRLPAPSAGDVFLDLEGDPFVGEGGLEYLFGTVTLDGGAPAGDLFSGVPAYRARWALDRERERAAFEEWVDDVVARRARHPDLHVYHFGAYEPGALKRLMGRYGTREAEIDALLRSQTFVDLHQIVRQSLRASVESYSIKDLEAHYGFVRRLALDQVGRNKRAVEHALELDRPPIEGASLGVVEGYNRDDCLSTLALRDWLETLRAGLIEAGNDVPRPAVKEGEAPEALQERDRETRALAERLCAGVPADPALRSEEERARWLLAQLLEYHRREDKAQWWEYYRMIGLSEEELLDERAAIAGLEHADRVDPGKRGAPTDRYRFPVQETKVRKGDDLKLVDERAFGEVVAVDPAARTVDVKKTRACADVHPPSFFAFKRVDSPAQARSLLAIGAWVAAHGIDAPGPHRAARDLLLGRRPRLRGDAAPLMRPGESTLDSARRLALDLEDGVLVIQGPPGSGKTFTGSRVILDLVRAGRKVGVTAPSHRALRNLLDATVAADPAFPVRCVHKAGEDSVGGDSRVIEVDDNAEALRELQGAAQVVGGTAWLWARADFADSVDVLVVDEAGQMALAQVLASSSAARSLILLGDPQQLDQVVKGSHPDGAEVSALEHVLQGRKTIPEEHGLFLAETRRLHPEIAEFTSEVFYEDRLRALPGLDRQRIQGPVPFEGAGLWFVPVEHEGNQTASPEEAEAIESIVRALTAPGVQWIDGDGRARAMGLDEVLIVAPYNAQVADLATRLPGARVGTVDKFQGQEAPVVICSMTSSSAEDAPRGMEFLYSLNRLNVATSRARCACILVGSPRLFEPECQTPRQMQLANAFCRFLERARVAVPARE